MKSTPLKIILFLMVLCGRYEAFSQYNGGDSDGNSSQELINTSCGLPAHYFAYTGGWSDGATVDTAQNISCSIPAYYYAYTGGNGDASASETIATVSCGIPPAYFAYMGGINDGAGVETVESTLCSFAPQYYAFFGGSGDGFSANDAPAYCPVAPPETDFEASATALCVGQSLQFTDISTNIPSAWSWTFTGGNPAISNVQNPVVTYNTPGTYTVSLTASNFNGSTTETKTGYITVYAVPTLTSTTPAARCDAGSVTLQATASVGTIQWYASASATTPLATGNNFVTPSLTDTTTYYVEAVNGVCTSSRIAVTATVNATPSITTTTPANRCGSGIVSLSATATTGTIQWYDAPTGGTLLANGDTFNVNVTSTTNYYVQVTANSCTSPRTVVTATVNSVPTITGTTPASRCDSGTVVLQAVASSGTLTWYSAPSGGILVGTGSSFTTPTLTTTTTYYVEATNGDCTTARIPVTASVTNTSTPIGLSAQTFCENEQVGMIIINGQNINWYASASGGIVLPTSTLLVSGTTYYASQTIDGCESSDRLAVTMTLGSCLGINDVVKKVLQVYPNPTSDWVIVNASRLIAKIEVVNLLGQIVYANQPNSNQVSVDVSAYPTATYILRVTVDNNYIETFKIIKK